MRFYISSYRILIFQSSHHKLDGGNVIIKIYQIEISNYCNLSCSYCPHKDQNRHKGYMSFDTFKKSLELVKKCEQKEIFLHNFGEPLMNPQIYDFIKYAVDNGFIPDFFSNGILLNETSIKRLNEAGLRRIGISEHVVGEIQRINNLIEKTGVDIQLTETFTNSDNNHNWAGQIGDAKSSQSSEDTCIFEKLDATVILWDGRLNTCCISIESNLDITIDDVLENRVDYKFHKLPLCDNCSLMRADELLK